MLHRTHTSDPIPRSSSGLLASPALCRLVTHFVLHPHADLHFHGLKRVTGLPNRSLQLELARLERLGLIMRKADGRLVRYVVQADVARWRALREMIRQFVEPADVLRVALANVAGIEVAFVYGSFARRHDVHPDSDVDVFVVSAQIDQSVMRTAVAAELLEVSGLLHREVNASRYTPSRLAGKIAEHSRFIATVLEGEKDWIIGSPAALAAVTRRSAAPLTTVEPHGRYGAHLYDRARP
ncbi:MAG: nucleotidyltransferase domain-containing protein [Gemmatimonadota bacterium]|mgnify:FL=1